VNSAPRQGIRLCACPMRRLLLATLLLLLLVPAAGAYAADNAEDLLVDACRDEKVDGTYSQRTYRRALDQLPADSDQYTACREVIDRARLAALTNRGGGGSERSSQPASNAGAPSTGSTGGGGSVPDSGASAANSGTAAQPSSGRRPQRTRTREKRRETQAPTATTTAPAAEPVKLLPAGPVGNVSAVRSELPASVVVLVVALCILALLAAFMIGWSRVVARRTR
jgi:hypothetical protein